MKRSVFFITFIMAVSWAICIAFVGQANATATYDATSSFDLQFSQLYIWPPDVPTYNTPKSGTGEHTEATYLSQTYVNVANPRYSQESNVHGQAGDATGTLSGTSQATAEIEQSLLFDFPTSTSFTITLLDTTLSANSATVGSNILITV